MKLTDTNRYYLPGQNIFLHVGTVSYNGRDFIAMIDTQTNQAYIEELTTAGLIFIEDDKLAQELNDFLVYNKVLLINRPMIPDKGWYYRKPNENK